MDAASPIAWPPDYTAEFQRRYRRGFFLFHDRDLQIKAMVYYKTHPIEWINDFCVTFDPRLSGIKTVPFVLFPKQVQFLEMLMEVVQTRESALVEKCRDVGATWMCVAFSVWLWLFHPGSTIGWGSNKEENVDKRGNPKAIFTKIRQVVSKLPKWMIPYGFTPREHATYMMLMNPENGSTITGEAGDNIGRSGRTTIFFKDESAHYVHSELIEASLSENTDVQIDISSVNGTGNVFYRRRMAGVLWQKGHAIPHGMTRVFIFDWRDHPAKTQEWYDTKRRKFESEGLLHIFAQEIDRDYSGSKEKIIIRPEWIEACFDAHLRLEGLGDWMTGKTTAGQDIADGGGDKNALNIKKGVVMTYADHWAGLAEDAASIALPACAERGVEELFYDAIGVGSGFKAGANALSQTYRNIAVLPWKGSWEVLDPKKNIIPDEPNSPKNEDQYENLKAQSWWRLRTRAYKTYQAVHQGKKYPVEELMSISTQIEKRHQLKMELSQAEYKTSGNGKTMVEKTPDGTLSPNLGDSAVINYNPVRKPVGFFD